MIHVLILESMFPPQPFIYFILDIQQGFQFWILMIPFLGSKGYRLHHLICLHLLQLIVFVMLIELIKHYVRLFFFRNCNPTFQYHLPNHVLILQLHPKALRLHLQPLNVIQLNVTMLFHNLSFVILLTIFMDFSF